MGCLLDLPVDVYYLNRVSFLPPVTKEGTAGLQIDAGQTNCASRVTAGLSDISTVTQLARGGLMLSLCDHQGNGWRPGAA